VAYVKGKPNDVSPATAATVISGTTGATGLRVTFDDCTGANGNGLDQVICRGIDFASNPETVDLTIRGERSDGLGFIGDAIGININNAATKCPGILQGQ
jgi:hypothetical protein